VKRTHHDLVAWQQAMVPVKQVYALTAIFPSEEKFGLVSQMRRAAVSIPSNIAEGVARNSGRELSQFPVIARGSLSELDTQLRIAQDLGFCEVGTEIEELVDRVFKLIGGLLNSSRKTKE
jgi:S23 ribosomal protein.